MKDTTTLQLILEDLLNNNIGNREPQKKNVELIKELIEQLDYNLKYKVQAWECIPDNLQAIYHDNIYLNKDGFFNLED